MEAFKHRKGFSYWVGRCSDPHQSSGIM